MDPITPFFGLMIRDGAPLMSQPSLEAFGAFPAWASSWKICWKAGSGGCWTNGYPQSSTFIGISCDFSITNLIPGWWLQTMEFDNLIFPCRFFGMSSETHWLSLHHFSRWARESTTNQIHFWVSVRCRRPCRRPRRLDSWDYKNLHGWVILDKGKCWCAYSSIMGCIWVYQD